MPKSYILAGMELNMQIPQSHLRQLQVIVNMTARVKARRPISATLMNPFAIAFTVCQFLNKFNSNCAHLSIVPCMTLHQSIYLHSSITQL